MEKRMDSGCWCGNETESHWKLKLKIKKDLRAQIVMVLVKWSGWNSSKFVAFCVLKFHLWETP